ncbi:DUF6010 family protein [Microbulbifer magnicolonia]|uniref:DUF6010 family protein n=1 Tax=Microbulbifer magnicolonia TaxID=3109744 RepID=UPI002B4176EC|nr:DUF6010 family protein [Microbulbifer sp. GG15]
MALTVIIVLYISIGLMSAVGTIFIVRRLFSDRTEQIFFGLFLVLIAAFYLAFVVYFGNREVWPLEATAVVLFTILGILGCRITALLVIGYFLHGVWDLLHELPNYANVQLSGDRLTEIPMAYGIFCATYDWCMAIYFCIRRNAWHTAWAERAG